MRFRVEGFGFPKIRGTIRGPYNKDSNICRSILGYTYSWETTIEQAWYMESRGF